MRNSHKVLEEQTQIHDDIYNLNKISSKLDLDNLGLLDMQMLIAQKNEDIA